jgi:hypothetical protein
MGNLSASQAATLSKLVKGITAHRSVVKVAAGIPTLPSKIATTSKYKSKTFGLSLGAERIVKN